MIRSVAVLALHVCEGSRQPVPDHQDFASRLKRWVEAHNGIPGSYGGQNLTIKQNEQEHPPILSPPSLQIEQDLCEDSFH